MSQKPIYLTPAELADRWGISASTVSTNVSRKPEQLPRYKKLGGRIRFDLVDIEAFEAWHTVDVHADRNDDLTGLIKAH